MRPGTASGIGPSSKPSFLNTVFRIPPELELLNVLAPPVSHDKPDIAVAESLPTLGTSVGQFRVNYLARGGEASRDNGHIEA